MKKRNILVQFTMHVIFCILLMYWFNNNSFIRPIANYYKESLSVIILLFIIYANIYFLLPKIFYRNRYYIYLLLSFFLVCLSGGTEMWMVESDIKQCVGHAFTGRDYRSFILNVLFMIILRNGSIYLFFSVLGLYYYNKKKTLQEKKAITTEEGIASFLRCNGKNIVLKTSKIVYFIQQRNDTIIHTTDGKCYLIYSSLKDIQEQLGENFLKISRNTLVNCDNIINFTHDHLLVKESKHSKLVSLDYFKNNPSSIYAILQKTTPLLEQKNNTITPKNNVIGGLSDAKYDEKTKYDGLHKLILEEIQKNPNISAQELVRIFKGNISLRTLERRLQELKSFGLIKSHRGGKERGYYIV